jgi:hypothetical protein
MEQQHVRDVSKAGQQVNVEAGLLLAIRGHPFGHGANLNLQPKSETSSANWLLFPQSSAPALLCARGLVNPSHN